MPTWERSQTIRLVQPSVWLPNSWKMQSICPVLEIITLLMQASPFVQCPLITVSELEGESRVLRWITAQARLVLELMKQRRSSVKRASKVRCQWNLTNMLLYTAGIYQDQANIMSTILQREFWKLTPLSVLGQLSVLQTDNWNSRNSTQVHLSIPQQEIKLISKVQPSFLDQRKEFQIHPRMLSPFLDLVHTLSLQGINSPDLRWE